MASQPALRRHAASSRQCCLSLSFQHPLERHIVTVPRIRHTGTPSQHQCPNADHVVGGAAAASCIDTPALNVKPRWKGALRAAIRLAGRIWPCHKFVGVSMTAAFITHRNWGPPMTSSSSFSLGVLFEQGPHPPNRPQRQNLVAFSLSSGRCHAPGYTCKTA